MGYPVFLQKTSVFVETCFYQTKKAAEPYVRQPPLATEISVYVRRTGIT